MVHLVFDRPTGRLKVFGPGAGLPPYFEAGGDAVTNGVAADGPYGTDWPCPPGHFVLEAPNAIAPPIPAEGAWQIPVDDLSDAILSALVLAGDANRTATGASIGGIDLPLGQIAQWGRSGIMIHGGGTALGDPACYAGDQPLCKTEGCTRMHNADLAQLVTYLQAQLGGNTLVYSIVGVPLPLGA